MSSFEREPMESSGWFLDSGNLKEIKKWKNVIGGVTTNQVILFKKEGIYNVPSHIKKICEIVGEGIPISVELPDSQATERAMVDLAKYYHEQFPKNIVVKVPIIPDDVKGLKVVAKLAKMGIRTNATIGINEAQLMLAAEASRRFAGEGSTYVSLFWGRALESKDRGESRGPEEVLSSTIAYITNHGLKTRVIVGSIRIPSQVMTAFELGADIVSVPPTILEKMMFTTRAKETVEEFDRAYLEAKKDPRLKMR